MSPATPSRLQGAAWDDGAVRPVIQSAKLQNVCYDIRGPVLDEAKRLEAEGHRILKLNIGNPAPFGFEAPEEILVDVIRNLPDAQGYSDSQGHPLGPPRGRAALPGRAASRTSTSTTSTSATASPS